VSAAEACLTCGAPLDGPPVTTHDRARACLAPQHHAAPAAPPQCFAGGCIAVEHFVVHRPSQPLLEPVVACQAHVGDLLGNIAKSGLRSSAIKVDLEVRRHP
jgi:hypothetical protein